MAGWTHHLALAREEDEVSAGMSEAAQWAVRALVLYRMAMLAGLGGGVGVVMLERCAWMGECEKCGRVFAAARPTPPGKCSDGTVGLLDLPTIRLLTSS